jgi:hypothetical protein
LKHVIDPPLSSFYSANRMTRNYSGGAAQYGSNKRNGESGQAQFEQFLALPFEPKTGDDSPYLNRIEALLRCYTSGSVRGAALTLHPGPLGWERRACRCHHDHAYPVASERRLNTVQISAMASLVKLNSSNF